MTHRFMLNGVLLMATLTMCVDARADESDEDCRKAPRDIRTLWTGNCRIRSAPFYTLFMSSFSAEETAKTKARLDTVFNAFNEDIADLNSVGPSKEKLNHDVEFGPIIRSQADLARALNTLENDIKEKSTTTDNVVFIYLLSHGENLGGQVSLNIGGQPVNRTDHLVNPIKEKFLKTKLARLVILITDNCAAVAPDPGQERIPLGYKLGGIWRALYFGHEGLVDIQTADPTKNQYAFLDGSSLFVDAFDTALKADSIKYLLEKTPGKLEEFTKADKSRKRNIFVDTLDKVESATMKKDGVVSWREFEEHLNYQMKERFKVMLKNDKGEAAINNQETQTILMNLDDPEFPARVRAPEKR